MWSFKDLKNNLNKIHQLLNTRVFYRSIGNYHYYFSLARKWTSFLLFPTSEDILLIVKKQKNGDNIFICYATEMKIQNPPLFVERMPRHPNQIQFSAIQFIQLNRKTIDISYKIKNQEPWTISFDSNQFAREWEIFLWMCWKNPSLSEQRGKMIIFRDIKPIKQMDRNQQNQTHKKYRTTHFFDEKVIDYSKKIEAQMKEDKYKVALKLFCHEQVIKKLQNQLARVKKQLDGRQKEDQYIHENLKTILQNL